MIDTYLLRSHPSRALKSKTITKATLRKLVFGTSLSHDAILVDMPQRDVWFQTVAKMSNGRLLIAGVSDTGKTIVYDHRSKTMNQGLSLHDVVDQLCIVTWKDALISLHKSGCQIVTPDDNWNANKVKLKRLYCQESCTNNSRDAFVDPKGMLYFVDDELQLSKLNTTLMITQRQTDPKINIIQKGIISLCSISDSRRIALLTSTSRVSIISLLDNSTLATSAVLTSKTGKTLLTTLYASDRFVIVTGIWKVANSETTVQLYLLSPKLKLQSDMALKVRSCKFDYCYSPNPVHSMLEVNKSGYSFLLLVYQYETVHVCLPRAGRLWHLATTIIEGRLPNAYTGHDNRILSVSCCGGKNDGKIIVIDLANKIRMISLVVDV